MEPKNSSFPKKLSRLAFPLFLVAAIVSMNYFAKIKDRYQSLNEGIYTCFARVGQTYTAKLLTHLDSPYLQKSFTKTTQECFAEGLDIAQNINFINSVKIGQTLNALASEVYWLHQNVRSDSEVASKIKEAGSGSIALNNRFSSLERLRDRTIDQVDSSISSISTYQTIALVFTFIFTGAMALILWTLTRVSQKTNMMRRPINLDPLQEKVLSDQIPTFNPLYSPFKSKADMMDEAEPQIESITSPSLGLKGHAKAAMINLGVSFNRVLSHLSAEINNKNIKLDLDYKISNYLVRAHSDSLEHIFFNIMFYLIKTSDELNETNKKITIENKFLGNMLSLRILAKKTNERLKMSNFSKDFMIIKELAKEEGLQFIHEEDSGYLIFAFVFDEVSIIESTEKKPRLSLVKKGKKRDLAREFQH